MESVQRRPRRPSPPHIPLLQRLSHYKEPREEMSARPTSQFNAPTPRFLPLRQTPKVRRSGQSQRICQTAGMLNREVAEKMKASVEALRPCGRLTGTEGP